MRETMAAASAAGGDNAAAGHAVAWTVAPAPVAYPDAVAAMEERVAAILAREAPEQVWLLEHPPLYTAGTSAQSDDLLDSLSLPVFKSGRGGQYTYHGPGQRVAYVMLDLAARGRMDLRCFVRDLERWLIGTLAEFGIVGACRAGRVGIWVETSSGEAKICGHRGASPPLGHLPRRLAQRRPRPRPLPGHRRLRHPRARRHLACGPRRRGHDGRRRPRPAAQLRCGVRRRS